ncbi:MAG: hypothetical protein IT227_02945 [Flavobacteriales bacterium]|nr:hypothetical protein [Flavobacteriales bacterium]
MGKLSDKRQDRSRSVRRSKPKRPKRQLPDVKRVAGSIPGMADWALEEVGRMRDEW